ncbi:MAG: glycosyltransferase [Bacteroidia bacterium]|nr:glycosyltransferase [Bacteroidia bacterium]
MNILYFTNKPIYPIIDGGCVAMDSFLQNLIALNHTVTHFTLSTNKHPFLLENYPETIQRNVSIISNEIDTRIKLIPSITHLFSSESYNVSRFFDISVLNTLQKLISSCSIEIILIESAFLLCYTNEIRKVFTGKIILRAPNVEYKIWENYTAFESNPVKKWYLNQLAQKLKKFEIKATKKIDGILTISPADAEVFKQAGVSTPIENIPFTIDLTLQKASFKFDHYFFIGAYNWKPNYDAALYLMRELFPKILQYNPNAILHIAGSYTPQSFYKYQRNSIKIYGKVEHVKDFMLNHGTLLAPIQSGSGVRIKILEALALGVPVIGTTIALQGIASTSCIQANSTENFIEAIERLKTSNINEIQEEARNYIKTHYQPIHIQQKISEFIENI